MGLEKYSFKPFEEREDKLVSRSSSSGSPYFILPRVGRRLACLLEETHLK